MFDVQVINFTSAPLRKSLLEQAARRTLEDQGRRVPVAIAVVDDRRMKQLHQSALGKRTTTDVLAWPMARAGAGADQIAVCLDAARREAARRGHPVSTELALYVVHWILHLAGRDDHAPARRARMWKRQEEILLGLRLRLRG